MTTYNTFAKFYDAAMGDAIGTVTLLQGLIHEFRPDATQVLELACGTGNILKGLSSTYQVTGLDLSEGMLEAAKKKVPDGTFYQGDMSNFSLSASFDVILCVFDSINHLPTFAQWQSLFQHVNQHLNARGLFIFDINTLYKLQRMAQSPTSVKEFNGNYLLMNITETEAHHYNWALQVFEQVGDNLYRRHETNILETSFAIAEIEEAVKEHLEIKRVFDPRNTEVLPTSLRVYFVCQRPE